MNQPKPNRFERNYGREVEDLHLDVVDGDVEKFEKVLGSYIDMTFREDWPVSALVNQLSIDSKKKLLAALSVFHYEDSAEDED